MISVAKGILGGTGEEVQLPVSACLAACLHYLYSKVLAHETSIALFKQDISETIWRSLAGDSLLLGWAYCIRVALQTTQTCDIY